MNIIKQALIGFAVGDALGVPVEFKSRENLKTNPVVDMIGYGTHSQPMGTWSDDSSLTFCLAESLCNGYDLKDIVNNFINWYEEAYWTAHHEVFDVGIATSKAITNLKNGKDSVTGGNFDEKSNGNGSLMRILPLIFYMKDKSVEERYNCVKEVSMITHGHIRSVISCFIYCEMALQLLNKTEKFEAFKNTGILVNEFILKNKICSLSETDNFHRILLNPIMNYEIKPVYEYDEEEISSSGYVLHSLEACFWCLLKSNSYKEAVLKAVNLGSDTDTIAAITGGLAGLIYHYDSIPEKWIDQLARKDEIISLCEKLNSKLMSNEVSDIK